MKEFGKKIISWYQKNKRDLPWRNTTDPYKIWLSEVILQQTRVDQGMSYYLKFEQKYPTVKALAGAKEDDVLRLWQGLGYYSRARNLHAAAKDVQSRFKGQFPSQFSELRTLKGIGEYTAAAIASFAFNLPHAVVDGNVYRVLSRYAGVSTPIDSTEGKKEFAQLAADLLGKHVPQEYNQAIMEFGAMQCKPVNPDCNSCPLNSSCYAFEHKKVSELPVKAKKTKIRNRYFHYLVIRDGQSFYIRKRVEKDIWTGLHDFPLIETEEKMEIESLVKTDEWKRHFGKAKVKIDTISKAYKHVLSHQHIHAKFYEIELPSKSFNEQELQLKKVTTKSIQKLAVPRLIEEYLKQGS